ncbi:MAG: molybdopterin cofactor-binding domain-containing protein [Sumerlaeia bacterium]
MTKKPDNNVALENDKARVGIIEKVAGRGKYTTDIPMANAVFAMHIRFPFGAGEVTSKNLDAARKVPGVLKVHWEKDDARYAGQILGHVVGESQVACEDSIEALAMKYKLGEVRADEQALAREHGFNKKEEDKTLKGIFAKAGAVVESEYGTQVQMHCSLEPHCALTELKDGKAEIWASAQGVISYRGGAAKVLDMKESDVTVRSEYVGGGFGSKGGPNAEIRLACSVAKDMGRPCRVIYDRREEQLDTGNRPGSAQYYKIAVEKNGKILGGRIHSLGLDGYLTGRGGVRTPSYYDFGEADATHEDVAMTAGLPRPFRAPGYPQASFAIEGVMDELAAKLGMDPLEFRKINETSDRRKRQYDTGAELIGWGKRQPDGSAKGRHRTGYGVGASTWFIWPTQAGAICEIHRDGHVVIKSGTQDIGTGTITVVADTAANELGIPREKIIPKIGNSDFPEAPTSGGSQTARSVVPAVQDACRKALARLVELAAEEFGDERALYQGDSTFQKMKSPERMSWDEVCALMTSESISEQGRCERRIYGQGDSDGVQFAKVTVDTDTGIVTVDKVVAVQAAGLYINRLTAENQVYGGVIQGLSYALFEERALDPVTGALLNDNMDQYKIAGSADVPEIVAVLDATSEDTGVRGLGEPTTIPTCAAIGNAVANAIGARVYRLPLTPDRVLDAMERAPKGARA